MTDWIRHGECNQCGDCCKQATNCLSLLVPIQDEAFGRVRFGEPVKNVKDKSGFPVFHIRGPIALACPEQEGNLCRLHDRKPQHCQDTPIGPDDIEGLPRCSYWFVHRETGEIKGTVQEVQP